MYMCHVDQLEVRDDRDQRVFRIIHNDMVSGA